MWSVAAVFAPAVIVAVSVGDPDIGSEIALLILGDEPAFRWTDLALMRENLDLGPDIPATRPRLVCKPHVDGDIELVRVAEHVVVERQREFLDR